MLVYKWRFVIILVNDVQVVALLLYPYCSGKWWGGEGRGGEGGAYCRGSLVWHYGLGGGWALVRSRVGRLFEGIRYMCVTEGASCEAQDFRMQEGWWSPGDEAGMQGEILSAPGDLFRLRFWIPHCANDLTSWTLCNVYELLGNNTVN